MEKTKIRTFQDRLREDLKDPEFLKHFKEEQNALVLALKIAKLRKRKRLTQKRLAERMGTSQQAISRLEGGEYEGFTLATLEKVAKATHTHLKIDFVP
jgi:DNA-binding Xre family transcriptional regulator